MHILFSSHLALYIHWESLAHFAKCWVMRVFIKWPKRVDLKWKRAQAKEIEIKLFTFTSLLDNFWIMFNSCSCFIKWPFPQISKELFVRRLVRGFHVVFHNGQWHDHIDTCFWKGGKKTVNFFGGQKLEVCFYTSYLSLH